RRLRFCRRVPPHAPCRRRRCAPTLFWRPEACAALGRHDSPPFLIGPPSLAIHALIIGFVPLWIFAIAGWSENARLVADITGRAHTGGLGRYIGRLLASLGGVVLPPLPPRAPGGGSAPRPPARTHPAPVPARGRRS